MPSYWDPVHLHKEAIPKGTGKDRSEGSTLMKASPPSLLSISSNQDILQIHRTSAGNLIVCQTLGWDLGTLDELGISPAFEELTVYLRRPEHKCRAQCGNGYKVHRSPSYVNE